MIRRSFLKKFFLRDELQVLVGEMFGFRSWPIRYFLDTNEPMETMKISDSETIQNSLLHRFQLPYRERDQPKFGQVLLL